MFPLFRYFLSHTYSVSCVLHMHKSNPATRSRGAKNCQERAGGGRYGKLDFVSYCIPTAVGDCINPDNEFAGKILIGVIIPRVRANARAATSFGSAPSRTEAR